MIDDDKEFLNLYYIYTEKHNKDLKIIPLTIQNPRQILRAVRDKRPDVIVCDLEMPQLSGLEVLHLLLSKQYNIPFILCNISSEENIDYFIEKSIPIELTFEELTSLIHKSYRGHKISQKTSSKKNRAVKNY